MEATVAATLRKLRWRSEHGSYYVDATSGKARELDVLARQFWRRPGRDSDRTATIHFVVECKTMKGWHLLFQPVTRKPRYDHRFEHWMGWELDLEPERVADALVGIGLAADEVVKTIQHIEEWQRGLPDIERSAFVLTPPAPRYAASAFRETNTDKEKEDLEQSVLWKAMQGTFSAIDSLRRSLFAKEIQDIKFGLRLGDHFAIDRPTQAASWAKDAMRHTAHYHPIVVVHAELRIFSGSTVKRVPWIRLEQRSIAGDIDRWVDVVHVDEFTAYAATISADYEKQMRKSHFAPWRKRRVKKRPASNSAGGILPRT